MSTLNPADHLITTHDHEAGHAHAAHHDIGFVRKYIFSTDHKIIGIQFLFTTLLMLLVGGSLALGVRWQLAFPWREMPVVGRLLFSAQGGAISPEFYTMLFTMHATVMIFLVIIPVLAGAFGNFLIPLQIGADDMAFPTLNMLSYWFMWPAIAFFMASFFIEGGAAAAGWTSYATLSANPPAAPGSGLGQTMWLLAVTFVGFSSMLGSVNYMTTIINMRAPGMTLFRMPMTIWAMFITAILQAFALPVLTAAGFMLLFERTMGMSFFTPGGLVINNTAPTVGGGQALLWQHLFWFYSHPAVYIMILPAMFMVSTMMIALPSAVKVFNWLGTLWGGNIQFTVPMLNAIGFVTMFVVGGLSGIFMAAVPVDIHIHDTYFIVAHFHYVLFGATVFGVFGAIHFWFPKMFGRMMSEKVGKVHFVLSFIGFNCTFFPMHMLGVAGFPRRLADPYNYQYLEHLLPLNRFITYSALLMGFAQFLLIGDFIYSIFKGKKVGRNPWHANGLEWTAPSPPGHGNFDILPVVYRGPYEYASPLVEEDFLPQTRFLSHEDRHADPYADPH